MSEKMQKEFTSLGSKAKALAEKYRTVIKRYEKIDKYLKLVFLILLMMNVAGRFLLTTTYGVYSSNIIKTVSGDILSIVALCRIPFIFSYVKESKRAVIYCAVFFVINCFLPSGFYKEFGTIMIGCVGIDYRKILKAYVITMGIGLSYTAFAMFTGATNHLVWIVDGTSIRDSFGVCYPTDFASYVFFAFLFFWIAWEKLPLWISAVLSACMLYVVYVYAQSDTCTICFLALLSVILLLGLFKGLVQKKPQIAKKKWIIDYPLAFAFPLFAALMFLMIFGYAQGFPLCVKLNSVLTGRLGLTLNAIRKYGFSLGGVAIKQAGNGFTTFPVHDYEFVDSSYPLILLTRGIVFFLLLTFLCVRMSFEAIKNKDYRLAFGLALIALHALAEHHFLEIHYNIILFVPCAAFPQVKEENAEVIPKKQWKPLASLGVIFAALLLSPVWISLVRTICGWRRFHKDGGFELAWAFAGYAFGVMIIAFVVAAILTKQKKLRIVFASGAGVSFLALVIFAVASLGQARKDVADIYNADASVLMELDKAAKGDLYSTEYPWLYHKALKKIRFVTVTGDDLGRKKNATVIVPRGTEYYVLLRMGFQYAAISDREAIYSNDEGVLQYLNQKGMPVHDYYDEVTRVELPLTTAEDAYLRKGIYRVDVSMNVSEMDEDSEEIAEILIVGDFGYTTLYREPVNANERREDGNVNLEIRLELKEDMPGMRFYVLGTSGCKVEVMEVSYQMIGKYVNNP
ncbi:MAG: hypothetical protein IK081_15620 [Lachnospiraceae bacterium]|nr:hypothetical protein [Lachnospiraceae bacterium]